jgi:hypothetical protein
MYEVGTILNCKGIYGVVVFPRKVKMVTVSWEGFNDLDDYSVNWIKENCIIEDRVVKRKRSQLV